jgi:hypothetical protein
MSREARSVQLALDQSALLVDEPSSCAELLELARSMHLAYDVATADDFAFYINIESAGQRAMKSEAALNRIGVEIAMSRFCS